MCRYVCVYIYIHVYIYTCTYIYAYIHIYTYVYINIRPAHRPCHLLYVYPRRYHNLCITNISIRLIYYSCILFFIVTVSARWASLSRARPGKRGNREKGHTANYPYFYIGSTNYVYYIYRLYVSCGCPFLYRYGFRTVVVCLCV